MKTMNKIDFDKVRNYYGETPKQIAREVANAIAEDEDFMLFCYWYECVYGGSLDDWFSFVEQYYINDEWREYSRKYRANNPS